MIARLVRLCTAKVPNAGTALTLLRKGWALAGLWRLTLARVATAKPQANVKLLVDGTHDKDNYLKIN